MGQILMASTGFAIIMELVVVPCFNNLFMDLRWSLFTFVGALMFLVACSNFLYCVDWHWFTWCNVCRVVVELTKFTSPWLLYRIIWIPMTRKIFRSLVMDYHFNACQASSRLSYVNLTLGCFVLLLSLLYNEQLPLDWLACWWQRVCCDGCRRAPGRCACPRVVEVDVIQYQGYGRVLNRIDVISREPGYIIQMFKCRR